MGGGLPQDGQVQAVLTCQGDIEDPDFPERCQRMFDRLSQVLENEELNVTKCEPWNSVKVTFNIPKDAAEKLARLAEAGDEVLRELGILSLQMEGGQVISMTMVNNDDSDSDNDRPNSVLEPKRDKDGAPILNNVASKAISSSKVKLSPKEDKAVTIKQEVVVLDHTSSEEPVRPAASRDTQSAVNNIQGLNTSMAAAAMLMKNLPSSATSLLLPGSDPSVLTSYAGSKEQLLASLIARGQGEHSTSATVSPLLGHLLRDSDEPASKKPRKTEQPSAKDSATYSYNKGFSLLPVSSATAASLRLTGSQSSPSSEPLRASPVGSALRLASLPGVSLTAVNSRNSPQPPASSHRLMPPPSSAVTLSPVPRTTSVVNHSPPSPVLTNPAELRCIETGDKPSVIPPPVVHSVDISPSKQSLTPKVLPLLINPVTGQFEPGSGESASESEPRDKDGAPLNNVADLDTAVDGKDRRTKHKSGSQSPGHSTSEQPLRIKLKVSSISNNSSKNLVTQKNDAVKNNVSNKPVDEPKVPKIKIRLGRDQTVVKLNNDVGDNDETNDLDEGMPPEKSHSPVPNDLKTKVKIKPLLSPPRDKDGAPLNNVASKPNSLANHTGDNDSGRKSSKKVMKKDKKDRLAVWTESLAKHGEKREEKKEERSKEAKSWPEVLESRLYGSGGPNTTNNSIPTNSSSGSPSFNKSDLVLENQAEKGEGSVEAPGCSSDPGEPHLNWSGPGRAPEPGPGPSPGSPRGPHPPPESGATSPHPPQNRAPSPNPPQDGARMSVLDILEGRPPTGEPGSPCPQGGPQEGAQQGEDSGIESMDSRSEKSPNQGESPFHATSESGADLGHLPTYSSSMGSSSGKLSPPVSDSGSVDSAVAGTPPDKSPSLVNTVQANHSVSSDSLPSKSVLTEVVEPAGEPPLPSSDKEVEEPRKMEELPSGEEEANDRNHSSSKNCFEGQAGRAPPDPVAESSPQPSPTEEQPKTDDVLQPFENSLEDLEAKSEGVLLRSCDGTDDLKVSPPKEVPAVQSLEITNCMHDYTFKDSNNLIHKNGDGEDTKTAGTKATLLTKRLIEAEGTAEPVCARVISPEAVPPAKGTPVSTVSLGLAGGQIQIRSTMQVPPGAKMVPVKLITVPGSAGNLRMLRVSPVKTVGGVFGGDGKVTTIGSTGMPPRTIVLKPSSIKVVTTQGLLAGGSLGTASLVRYPAPTSCDTAASPEPSHPVSQSSIAALSTPTTLGVSLLKKSHSVNLTPVQAVGLPPTSLDPCLPTKAAPVMFEKRASVDERRSREEAEAASVPAPLSVDVSQRLSDSEQMPSPARKAAQQPSAQQPSAQQPSAQQPSAQQPAGQQPAAQQHAAQLPADQQLSAQQPVSQPVAPKLNGTEEGEGAPYPSTKLKEPSGDATNGKEPGEGEVSLLRPLLASTEEDSPEVHELAPLLPSLGPRKRSRRNTGSSAASDRSDLSAVSEPGAKRRKGSLTRTSELEGEVRETSLPREASPQEESPEDGEELEEGEEGDDEDLDEEEQETNSESESEDRPPDGEKNGLSGVASKTLGRSTGEKLKGRPPNSDKNFKLVNKKTSPKTKGVTKKVGRPKTDDQNAEKSLLVGNAGKTDLAARRVSTRSKKPDEPGPTSKRR